MIPCPPQQQTALRRPEAADVAQHHGHLPWPAPPAHCPSTGRRAPQRLRAAAAPASKQQHCWQPVQKREEQRRQGLTTSSLEVPCRGNQRERTVMTWPRSTSMQIVHNRLAGCVESHVTLMTAQPPVGHAAPRHLVSQLCHHIFGLPCQPMWYMSVLR